MKTAIKVFIKIMEVNVDFKFLNLNMYIIALPCHRYNNVTLSISTLPSHRYNAAASVPVCQVESTWMIDCQELAGEAYVGKDQIVSSWMAMPHAIDGLTHDRLVLNTSLSSK